jgi:signal peptidase II
MSRQSLFGFLLALAIFVADQASKVWIMGLLGTRAPPDFGQIEISAIFDLTMVWNYGVSFGLLRAGSDFERWLLVGLSAVIASGFAVWMARASRITTVVALGLVIGGAIGNMIDRIRFGAVADFFDFSGLFFPYVFNVADAAITVGAILLALEMLFTKDEPKTPA